MTRAELVAEVRRLADETAGLAAEVRRGDVAVGLLGQVRDFGHRLPPGLAADIRRVVDDMVAARHEAQAGPHSPAAGTSSAGGSGQRPPAAPSTETRQAAQDGQSGSGRDATDGVSAHQPTPQAGDVWERRADGLRACVNAVYSDTGRVFLKPDKGATFQHTTAGVAQWWELVERDGKPWPPAQEPEPGEDCGQNVEAERPEPDDPSQEPATDEDITRWEAEGTAHVSVDRLIARLRQEQAALLQTNGWLRDAERERDEAVDRTYAAVDRANAAEAALARVERVTAAERAVIEAAQAAVGRTGGAVDLATWRLVSHAVRALRDAQEAGQ